MDVLREEEVPSAPLSLDPIVPIVLEVQELEGRTLVYC